MKHAAPRRWPMSGRLTAVVAVALVVLAGGGLALYSASGASGSSGTTVAADPAAATASTAAPTTTTTAPPTTTTTAQVAGSQLPPGPHTLYVLGDSVILGAKAQVPAALTGWDVTFDAKESRRIDQGIDIVRAKGGAVGRVLVVHLCTNWGGGDYRAEAEQLLGSLHGVDRVVWVTCTPWLPAVADADAVIASLPQTHPNVVVADWGPASATPGYTYDDHLHLRPEGAQALAQLVASVVGPAPAPG